MKTLPGEEKEFYTKEGGVSSLEPCKSLGGRSNDQRNVEIPECSSIRILRIYTSLMRKVMPSLFMISLMQLLRIFLINSRRFAKLLLHAQSDTVGGKEKLRVEVFPRG